MLSYLMLFAGTFVIFYETFRKPPNKTPKVFKIGH